MRVLIVTPAAPGSRHGNRVTALRWQRILRGLGHRVRLAQGDDGKPADLLVALHARRSHPAVAAFRRRCPGRPILVALTGTDIHHDLPRNRAARESLALADGLIALHSLADRQIPRAHRAKVRVILQSFPRRGKPARRQVAGAFQVAVLGHMRAVKDPLRAAVAARDLPAASRIRVVQAGAAMQPQWAQRARREMARNPRYTWRGALSAAATARLLAQSQVLVVSSLAEGGANVVSEAIGLGVPVLASRIPGNVGLLGAAYPGYFPAGNTKALRRLMRRAERDARFLARLRSSLAARVPRFEPSKERQAWMRLLKECAAVRGSSR